MSYIYSTLAEVGFITDSTSIQTVFTNPAAQYTYIQSIHLHNTDSDLSIDVEVWKVPSGSSAQNSTRIDYISVPANSTERVYFLKGGLLLATPSDKIMMRASIKNKVTVQIYGQKSS